MKKTMFGLVSAVTLAASAAVPEAFNVKIETFTSPMQISYDLSEDAIVTVDIQTNVTGTAEGDRFASIGGANQWYMTGDVNGIVKKGAGKRISWRSNKAWPGHTFPAGVLRAVVTAWPTNSGPDYLVVDLMRDTPRRLSWYPTAEHLPGGLLTNEAYRRTMMVMRRIHAAGVTWTMGSIGESGRQANESPHLVTLTNDYYIGVFEVTCEQRHKVNGNTSVHSTPHYPMHNQAYRDVRGSDLFPEPPNSSSEIGKFRLYTGVDFDLPSEAQWEYACRAGHGESRYGDGSAIGAEALARIANSNKGWNSADSHIVDVGSFEPNDWGLYDMYGNVFEHCIDWYEVNIALHDGRTNADGAMTLSGAEGVSRIRRGGCFATDLSGSRSARRDTVQPGSYQGENGYRLVCRAGLE